MTLKDVKPFGTEGRLGDPEHEIAPSGEVYPLVVFRGSDVQDLSVLDYPPPSTDTTDATDATDIAVSESGHQEYTDHTDHTEHNVYKEQKKTRRPPQSTFNAQVPDANFDFTATPTVEQDDLQRPVHEGPLEPAYDKKKSFFDNISNSATQQRPQRGRREGGHGGAGSRGQWQRQKQSDGSDVQWR